MSNKLAKRVIVFFQKHGAFVFEDVDVWNLNAVHPLERKRFARHNSRIMKRTKKRINKDVIKNGVQNVRKLTLPDEIQRNKIVMDYLAQNRSEIVDRFTGRIDLAVVIPSPDEL